MTNLRKLTTATAIAGTAAFLSSAAFAGDMKCADFNAMSAEDQLYTSQDWNAGREGMRDEARGDDPVNVDGTENVSDDLEVDGGREEARDMAMGSDEDVVKMMADYCSGDQELMLKDMRHPSEDKKAE